MTSAYAAAALFVPNRTVTAWLLSMSALLSLLMPHLFIRRRYGQCNSPAAADLSGPLPAHNGSEGVTGKELKDGSR